MRHLQGSANRFDREAAMNIRMLIDRGSLTPCPPRNRRLGIIKIIGVIAFAIIAIKLGVSELQINHIGF